MATRAPSFRPRPGLGSDIDLFGAVRDIGMAQRSEFEATRRPMQDWALLVPEPGIGELDFEENFVCLVEPFYSDEVAQLHEVVYRKSTQVGASTGSWRWAAREADQFARTVIYTFPTQDHVNDFGDERIEPAIEASDYLRSRIPGHFVKHKRLKRIGLGWLHLRGAKSRAGAQSVAAQSLVFDEYDELDPSIIAQFERRLSGARARGRAPRLRRLGIPSIPGYGIDAAYQASDQREWHVECPNCGHVQRLDFFKSVRWMRPDDEVVYRGGEEPDPAEGPFDRSQVEAAWRACVECDQSLEGDPLREGRWIALNPEHPIRGYFVHRLLIPGTDLIDIVKGSLKTAPHDVEAFFRNDLGTAYSPAEASLTEEAIKAACSFGEDSVEGYNGLATITAGLDVASERALNMRISEQLPDGRRKALWIGLVKSFEEAYAKAVAFHVGMMAVDSMPERRLARALAAQLPGRVVLVRYDDQPESDALRFDPKKNIVTVNRTEAIDAMMDSIRQVRNIPLQRPPHDYVKHLMAPKRRTEYSPTSGKPKRVYVSTGPDDYAHAEVYDLVATELWRLKVAAGQMQDEAAGQPVDDSTLGVERGTLDALSDNYEPGFGEKW